jgi:hypothetical protein
MQHLYPNSPASFCACSKSAILVQNPVFGVALAPLLDHHHFFQRRGDDRCRFAESKRAPQIKDVQYLAGHFNPTTTCAEGETEYQKAKFDLI